MPNPGDIIGGRYQIMHELGSGGFGTTYLAKDIELPDQTWCVVKQLQPRFNSPLLWQNAKERFRTEAMVLQRLGNHPQIPQLLAHLEENQEFYLVQEFIDGEELRREVNRQLLDETQTIALLKDVLQVLDFVHRQGVIHRDIKPSNLIRRRDDQKIVLIDFGAVKEIGTLSFNAETQTLMTSVIGTPGYMSPEQQNGRPVYSSDIYALGRTVIYALTGQSPIELEDTESGDLKTWQKSVPINPKLTAILRKMLSPKSGDRYTSAADVLRDLEPLLKIGETVGGRYQITHFLGGGIWSYTYLANNLQQIEQSPCVIKQLKTKIMDSSALKEAERRFSTELTVLERLGDHPQIPKLWDHFKENGEFYLVQEFIAGEDLSYEIQQGKRLREETVVNILHDVLEILDFIHKQRVIHRDIKPSNLIRRRSDDKIVLIDFGVVKEIVNLPPNERGYNSSTQPIGTEGYISPEQMAGRPTFGSDIYALGMTAIQALVGLPPDQFPTNPQTGAVIWKDEIQVNPKLAKILDKMVLLDVGKRYQSAAEILKVLKINKRRKGWLLFRSWYSYILVSFALFGFLIFARHRWVEDDAINLLKQGDISLKSKEYEKAILYYDEGLKEAQHYENAWLNKAQALNYLRRYQEMLQTCEAALNIFKDSVYLWNCKGLALEGLGKSEQAIAAYNQAIVIDPNFYESWNNRGYIYRKLRQNEAAIADFKKAIESNPQESYVPLNNLGQIYFQMGDYAKAKEAYTQAITVKKDYLPAWIGLGNLQKALALYQEAIKSYEQAISINNNSDEAWYGKGLVQEALKDYKEAQKSYQRALEIKPDYQAAKTALQRVSSQ